MRCDVRSAPLKFPQIVGLRQRKCCGWHAGSHGVQQRLVGASRPEAEPRVFEACDGVEMSGGKELRPASMKFGTGRDVDHLHVLELAAAAGKPGVTQKADGAGV